MHTVSLKPTTQPRDLAFPQPASSWLERDITKQDWATFVNYLLPNHIDTHNVEVANRKLKAELVDERMHRLTLTDEDRSMTNLDNVNAQLEPLRQQTSEAPQSAQVVVDEWNEGFFAPRCVHIDLELAEEPSPDELTKGIPGAWTHDEKNAQHNGDTTGNNAGVRGWLRADNDGFHVGRNLISADSNGFRMGRSAIVADNNGFRMGNLLVADSNGFRLGSMVADKNGFRIGSMRFGGSSTQSMNQTQQQQSGRQPQQSSADDVKQDGQKARRRSHSRSSSSSSSSSESEASVGSLPDYDSLTPAQLPTAKRCIQEWLNHPDQPITANGVRQACSDIDESNETPAEKSSSKSEEIQVLRREVKVLMLQFKSMKRAQKAEKKRLRRQHKAQRRAQRRSKRQDRLAAKRDRRDEERRSKEAMRKDKGKSREIASSPNIPRAPRLHRGFTTAKPPRPLRTGSEAERLWLDAQRIRNDATQVREDGRKTYEQMVECTVKNSAGDATAEDEKMVLKLRDIAEGLEQEANGMEREADRLETEALRLADEEDRAGPQESGVLYDAA